MSKCFKGTALILQSKLYDNFILCRDFGFFISYPVHSISGLLQDSAQAGESCDLCRRDLCWSEVFFCSFPIRKNNPLNNAQPKPVK